MTKKQNAKIIKLQPDLRPSRFIINLKLSSKHLADKESSMEKFENLLFKLDKVYLKKDKHGVDKKDELKPVISPDIIINPEDLQRSADKIFDEKPELKVKSHEHNEKNIKNDFTHVVSLVKLFYGVWKNVHNQATKITKKIDKRFGNLAFYFIFKIIFVNFYRIIKIFFRFLYFVGWLPVYMFKFIVLSFYKVTLPIIHIFRKFNISLFQIIIKFIYLTSGSLDKIADFIYYISRQHKYIFDKFFTKLSLLLITKKKKENNIIEIADNCSLITKKIVNKVEKKVIQFNWKNLLPRPTFSSACNSIPFAIILIIIILPIVIYLFYGSALDKKGKVLGITESAFNDFLAASLSTKAMDFDSASQKFSEASQKFLVAQAEIKNMSLFFSGISLVVPSQDIKMAAASDNILRAGQITANIGSQLNQALTGLFLGDKNLIIKLDNFSKFVQIISVEINELNNRIVNISPDSLPKEYREKFILIKSKSSELGNYLTEFNDALEKLKIFLGASKDKRYLFVFQNNAELRATGGFIGSFALVDFKEGKVKNIEVPGGGTYDTEAGLFEKIISPKPLHIVNPLWHLWDSNWWPDWAKSAKKIMWFYEKSDGPTVDGVISLTPTVVENALRVIGPIDMTAEYGVIIDSENFWKVAQEFSERKPDVTKMPKKFIGDLMNKIINKLPTKLNQDMLIKLLSTAEQSLAEKQILFYFTDPELEKKIIEYGWDGGIKDTTSDYLAVINTNIAGGKSDRKIEQTISHKAMIMNDGSIIDEVIVKRVHTGLKNEDFSGVRNVDYMRFYVPEGSELIEAKGFSAPDNSLFETPDRIWKNDPDLDAENLAKIDVVTGTKIYQESGKTIFANWSQVDPASSTEVYIKYKLPFDVQPILDNENILTIKEKIYKWFDKLLSVEAKQIALYSLLAQKQSGSNSVILESSVSTNGAYNLIWHYPEDIADININNKNKAWQIQSNLNEDRIFSVAFEINNNN